MSAQTWDLPAVGEARLSWEYDVERERLLALYQKGKDKQWDAQYRIDWDLELDEENPLGFPVETGPLQGIPYLGMQVLIEGLALAAFGGMRDHSANPLAKQVVAYVMQDEARHVAFGRMALKDAYADLTSAERDEREEFVVEACYLMRDRFRSVEVWEDLGYDVQQVLALTEATPAVKLFRNRLFTRIVPCIKDIGLWGERVQKAYADM